MNRRRLTSRAVDVALGVVLVVAVAVLCLMYAALRTHVAAPSAPSSPAHPSTSSVRTGDVS